MKSDTRLRAVLTHTNKTDSHLNDLMKFACIFKTSCAFHNGLFFLFFFFLCKILNVIQILPLDENTANNRQKKNKIYFFSSGFSCTIQDILHKAKPEIDIHFIPTFTFLIAYLFRLIIKYTMCVQQKPSVHTGKHLFA